MRQRLAAQWPDRYGDDMTAEDFDQLMLPNRRHGFAGEPYVIRRRWDYFVKNLLGVDPPEYELHPPGTPGARPAS